MAASGTSLWPALQAGKKARASEVETKFDWLEANILPMLSGSTTDVAYDLGTSTARWNFGNIDKVVCQAINPTTTAKCVVIGTTTAVSAAANNSDVSLELAGPKAFLPPRLTTTQKNNLAGINGMFGYDSTLNKFQGYENGAWTNMGGAAIGFVAPVSASVSSASTTTVASITAVGRLVRMCVASGVTGVYVGQLTLDGVKYGNYVNTTTTTQYLTLANTVTANTAATFIVNSTTLDAHTLDLNFKTSLIVYHSGVAGNTVQTRLFYETA